MTQNDLNEAEMRGMKEILGPKSNLELLKLRLPIGRELKIEASDWSRADDFKNSSHRPFVKKSLSFHSFLHHSGVFGFISFLFIQDSFTSFSSHYHYMNIRLILPTHPRTKQV